MVRRTRSRASFKRCCSICNHTLRRSCADEMRADRIRHPGWRTMRAFGCRRWRRAASAAEALAQPLQLRPDVLAAEFPLEFRDRGDARIGTQARQPRRVARAWILDRDRRSLRLLPGRCPGVAVRTRSRRRGGDAFVQALHLRPQPDAGEFALEPGDFVRHRIGAQTFQTLFVAITGRGRIGLDRRNGRCRRFGGLGFRRGRRRGVGGGLSPRRRKRKVRLDRGGYGSGRRRARGASAR